MTDNKTPQFFIEGGWLTESVDEHTCGAGINGHHEPGCGLVPVCPISELPEVLAAGFAAINAAKARSTPARFDERYDPSPEPINRRIA